VTLQNTCQRSQFESIYTYAFHIMPLCIYRQKLLKTKYISYLYPQSSQHFWHETVILYWIWITVKSLCICTYVINILANVQYFLSWSLVYFVAYSWPMVASSPKFGLSSGVNVQQDLIILYLKIQKIIWVVFTLGLCQLCLKFCLLCFQEFPKNLPYYAQVSVYCANIF